jgi:hypothetical protein
MLRILPVLSVLPLLAVYGLLEGLWTDRWRLSAELEQAQARLAGLPSALGPWQGTDEELDPRQVRQAELRAHLLRRYRHRETGETVTVLAVCGRPGPVTVHSPDVCYGGAGFSPAGPRQRHAVGEAGAGSTPAEFWAERYHRPGAAVPEQVQLYYSWNAGGGWVASDRPRLDFARHRALYKLYVSRQLSRPDEPAEQDPIPGLLRLLVPELARLFGGP